MTLVQSDVLVPALNSSLGHAPGGDRWAFDESVTECFDDMLARSIPQYEVMRDTVTRLAVQYARPGTAIVDMGCSRGEAIARLLPLLPEHQYLGLELSKPMLAAARARFAPQIDGGRIAISEWDLRQGYPAVRASVTLSVLTLQFTPIEYRLGIVRNVFRSTIPGGVFILVEKVLGDTAEIDALMVDSYLALKAANGYGRDEIERKRHSLEGVLVPVTARWNEEILTSAGFRHVGMLWRYLNFVAWIAIREGDVWA